MDTPRHVHTFHLSGRWFGDLVHQWKAPDYGSTVPKLAHPTDNSPELKPDEAINVQQLLGNILYYACAVDPEMLVTGNTIAAEQLKMTQETAKNLVQIINYAATHPEAITRYYASRTTLHMHINVSFLSSPVYKSRTGGFQYLIEPPKNSKEPPSKIPST